MTMYYIRLIRVHFRSATTEFVCLFTAVKGDNTKYIQNGRVKKCPPGALYNEMSCSCTDRVTRKPGSIRTLTVRTVRTHVVRIKICIFYNTRLFSFDTLNRNVLLIKHITHYVISVYIYIYIYIYIYSVANFICIWLIYMNKYII